MNYLTATGLEKLKQELSYLRDGKRKEIAERLRRAASFGDLSENFDYATAREEQAMTERRIAELELLVANAKLMTPDTQKGVVQLGSRVLLETGKQRMSFSLCGPQEANPLEGKISVESPVGSQLLGKKKGEVIELETPEGKIKYKVLSIT